MIDRPVGDITNVGARALAATSLRQRMQRFVHEVLMTSTEGMPHAATNGGSATWSRKLRVHAARERRVMQRPHMAPEATDALEEPPDREVGWEKPVLRRL
ncbi:MAG: hypothetical protein ACT4P7_07950 [Gemmatimonadaceae bacterium]